MVISKTQPMRSAEIDVIDYVNDIESHVDEIDTLNENVENIQTTLEGFSPQYKVKDGDTQLSNSISNITSIIGNGFLSNTITEKVGEAFIQIYNLIGIIGNGFDSENTISDAINDVNNVVTSFIDRFKFGKTNLITIAPDVTQSIEVNFETPFVEQSNICVFICLINDTEPFSNINLSLTGANYEGFTFDISSVNQSADVHYAVGYVAIKID